MSEAISNPKGLVGSILGDGRYDLRELLGGGSMGHVYRALDRRLETHVVVKIPHKSRLEHPDFLRRFRQESRFLVRLSHPHIVSILDVDEHNGVPFFVMPFVGGGSLRDRQRDESGLFRAMTPASLRGWLMEIARALDFIHSRDCVHRDVKPDNILFDEQGHPFLSDFGLSKLLRPAEEGNQAQTAAGAVVGTPLYVAPELVLGEALDGRADQYSLAVTVYEALTATNPFEGANSTATMVNHTSRIPPPLSDRRREVSRALSDAVQRGLAKSPEERFATCVEFAAAVLDGIPTQEPAASRSGSETHVPPPRDSAPSAAVDRSSVDRASVERSSAANTLGDTSPGAQRRPVAANSARSPVPASRNAGAVTTARSVPTSAAKPPARGRVAFRRIVKGRSNCPRCDKLFLLKPDYAGKAARCKQCDAPLLIAPDFSEVRLQTAPAASGGLSKAGSSGNDQSDLVLGQELFGWKIGQRGAIALALALVVVLMLLTMFFTSRAGRVELEKERERVRPKSTESE